MIHVENCEPYLVGLPPRLFKTAYRYLIVYALFLGFEQLIIETVLAGHAQSSFTVRGMSSLPIDAMNRAMDLMKCRRASERDPPRTLT